MKHDLVTAILFATAITASACAGDHLDVEDGADIEVSAATTSTFVATADAEVRAASPGSNYGREVRFAVDGSPERHAHLKFDVRGLAGPVSQATLRCWVVDATSDGPEVLETASSWSETGITWNQRPLALSGPLDDLGAVAAGGWASFDVTGAVTGDGLISFVLVPTSQNALGCNAREAAGNRPNLVIETMDAPPPSTVMMADVLLDGSGINTKIFYGTGNIYGDNPGGAFANTDAVIGHVLDWGGRIVREHVAIGGSSGERQRRAMPRFAAAGIRWHVTLGDLKDVKSFTLGSGTTLRNDAERVRTFARARIRDELAELVNVHRPLAPGGDLSRLVHSLAGPNEVDNVSNNGPFWAENARIFQEELWNQARAIPALSGIPIAAPSTRTDLTPARAAELAGAGNIIQTWSNRGNPHLYQHGVSPTDFLDEMLATIEPISGTRPAIFSETGYNNAGFTGDGTYIGGGQNLLGNPVPEWVASVYGPRALCDFARRGAVYTRFELLDDPDASGTSREAHFGLIRMTRDTVGAATPSTWVRKPEFHAVRRMHNLLRDPGGAFVTTALDHQIVDAGPAGTNLQRLLVQKRDGRHFLILWRDVDVFDPDRSGPGTVLAVKAQPIAIRLGQAATVKVYQPNEATAAGPGSAAATAPVRQTLSVAAGGTFTVQLAGDLKVMEID